MSDEIFPVVIGTAGHVDHGKSSLVRALSGTNPDRLKEEQSRGLTIDLGFANIALPDGRRVGIIDVPGHERFIKNMVTGATGIGYAVLVVAADDSVMPQTREHLQIIELMGVSAGCIALTKVDLADQEMIELVEEEISEACQGTFLEDTKIHRVSTKTGEGVAALHAALCEDVVKVKPLPDDGAFRMPVQRVFSAKGHGAVLTGIPLAGKVALGDGVETYPSAQVGKLRGIQAYHGAREVARAGHSSALNVSGVEHAKVERGHIVAAPGYLRSTKHVVATFVMNPEKTLKLKSRAEVKVHLCNSEHVAKIVLLDTPTPEVEPGGSAVVCFEFEEPGVPAVGDRYILRRPSPAETIGGGRVISLVDELVRPKESERIQLYQRVAETLDSPRDLLALKTLERGSPGASVDELAQELWIEREKARSLVDLCIKRKHLRSGLGEKFIHKEAWEGLSTTCEAIVRSVYERDAASAGVRPAELAQRLGVELKLMNLVVEELVEQRVLARVGEVIAHTDFVAALPEELKSACEHLQSEMKQAAIEAIDLESLPSLLERTQSDARKISEFLIARDEAVVVGGTFLYDPGVLRKAREKATAYLEEHQEMRAADFKNLLETSRKYAIPLLEYFDSQGVFANAGGVRRLKRQS